MERPALESILRLLEEAAAAESLDLGVSLAGESAAAEFCTAVKKACATKVNHPVFGATYRTLQGRISDISGAMLDGATRAQLKDLYSERFAHERERQRDMVREVLATQKRMGKVYDDALRETLIVHHVRSAGSLLNEADIDAAARELGLGRESSAPKRPIPELISPNEMKLLAAGLKAVSSKGDKDLASLYDFLHVSPGASQADIAAAIAAEKKFWSTKRADATKSAAQALWQQAEKLLTAENRHRYDLTREYLILEEKGVWKHFAAFAADAVLEPSEVVELQRLCAETSIVPEDAEELIAYEADRRGVRFTGSTAPAPPTKRCGYCGRSADVQASACTNPACGKSFTVRCLECNTTYQSSAAACSKCGMTLGAQAQIEEGVVAIDSALGRNDVERAKSVSAELLVRYGNQKTVQAAAGRVRSAVDDQEKALAGVLKLRAERKLVAAAGLLEAAAAGGRLSAGGKAQLEAIRADIARAEQLVNAATGKSDADGFTALEAAYAICVDSPRVRAAAARFRPDPPMMMTAEQRENLIALKWAPSPSVSVSGYRVLRKLDSAPSGPTDGVEIAVVGTTRFEDSEAPVGRRVYYSVTAERLGLSSAPLFSHPVVRTAPIAGLRVVASSGWVRATWKLPVGASGALVTRTANGTRVNIPANKDGFTDSTVTNGTEYSYSVQAEFAIPDGVRRAAAVTFAATPKTPPKPPANAVAHVDGRAVSIRFDADAGASVVVVKSTSKPALSDGQLIDVNELETAGDLIRSAHPGAATDTLASGGVYYYTLASIDPPQAAIGPTVRVLALDDCSDLKVYPKELEALAKWTWPGQAKVAVLALTRGKPAESADDPGAIRLEVTRHDYDRAGGYSFAVPVSDDYHVRIFAGYAEAGGFIYASGAEPSSRTTFRAGAKSLLTYTLTKTLFGKYQLKLHGPSGMQVPSFALIAKPSFAPISANDGSVFFNVAAASLASGSATIELPAPPKGHCLKVFFEDPLSYETVQINHPPADTLKVK